ncbi:MAG: hypothetical protein DCC75_13235 [Proteobacteria bacterium]|nr:MAG: hypothetical protein DCC75_13235 [Pseudomonadota bacterium]
MKAWPMIRTTNKEKLFPLVVLLIFFSGGLCLGLPPETTRIAFGSCANQNQPLPILRDITAIEPEFTILLGDNVYLNRLAPARIEREYAKLTSLADFAKLREGSRILAIWDDNDYGLPDTGKENSFKASSKEAFLEFISAPPDDIRRTRNGIYDSILFGPPEKRGQIILLDTRWFRDPLTRNLKGDGYVPGANQAATILGAEQWRWFEEQLNVPAKVRVIASSIQVIADEHRFEKWANFPKERQRLLDLIAASSGLTLIISGDRHHAEISKIALSSRRDLYEITASSFNQPREPGEEQNRYRVGVRYMLPNFGAIEIDWGQFEPRVKAQIVALGGESVTQITASLLLESDTP